MPFVRKMAKKSEPGLSSGRKHASAEPKRLSNEQYPLAGSQSVSQSASSGRGHGGAAVQKAVAPPNTNLGETGQFAAPFDTHCLYSSISGSC